ncbi:MAG: hypothetical protein KGH72_00020 [Candidatus Micrarchaeota archaeon]|nr:hypothetical protein [Candidatus Micrarchaeota archaeon]
MPKASKSAKQAEQITEGEENKGIFYRIINGNVGKGILILGALIASLWVANQWYDNLPQIIWQTQGISASPNTTINACTIQAFASVCPFTITNNQPASIFLENTGGEPAYFHINFSSSHLNKLAYYTNSSFVKAGSPTVFSFIPSLSSSKNFSISITANCTGTGLLPYCKGSNPVSRICNYQVSANNSQVATYIPKSVN